MPSNEPQRARSSQRWVGMASVHAGPAVSSFATFVSFVVKHYVRHLGPRSAPGYAGVAALMLWLALYFPQLPLEIFVRGRQQAGALAIVEQLGGREQVSRCNAAAQAYGIRPGVSLPAALSLCAGLSVQLRDRARERQALDELALWAYQFSSGISFEPSLLLLEVGASLRLFGGLPALLETLQRELEQIGYGAQHALAPTPTAAGLLARNLPWLPGVDAAAAAGGSGRSCRCRV